MINQHLNPMVQSLNHTYNLHKKPKTLSFPFTFIEKQNFFFLLLRVGLETLKPRSVGKQVHLHSSLVHSSSSLESSLVFLSFVEACFLLKRTSLLVVSFFFMWRLQEVKGVSPTLEPYAC